MILNKIYKIKNNILKILSLFVVALVLSSCTNSSLERKIIDVYFTDSKGKPVEKMSSDRIKNEYIYFVVKTQNLIGEMVTVDLEGSNGVIYNNRYIADGDNISVTINNNEERIKLFIYDDNNSNHNKMKQQYYNNTSFNQN
ncbi:hypothetical protein [Phocoenobacter skyensis]|uniref:Lipoprotein n=1 Tax=Phocoenobacter skyensis TaxID=97481 RepID=A0A1H7W552_9PAST|nr:hypothetical protein [Pasteurella skyensis]MDP8079102.1 hypothetical protein [Pasteurella skyensis]MDP8085052.1 hypothetical protein [Pasteurella skyensis]MDP8170637.1 hypothetical protein [Pasteurella skyensis]MDP8174794.1 hypothetical protein [Pasteurella skyensis]MDP8185048.1 hypothetical protein [Pasteurella skyensis]